MIELELKAVVADPADCRARLVRARAAPGFSGMMEDRRFDRGGELARVDQVLRVRHYRGTESTTTKVSWKGPARVVDGYKERDEIELVIAGDSAEVFLRALGYDLTESIDRRVEYYTVAGGAVVRLEWYPRMDVLVEVEGTRDQIEQAVLLLGIDRLAFTAESLAAFVARYEAKTGGPAATSRAALGAHRPSWELA